MKRRFTGGCAALSRAALALVMLGASASAMCEQIVGLLNGNRIRVFDSASPSGFGTPLQVTTIGGGTLVGIDLRPSTGVLYGYANDGSLFTIDAVGGVATLIGTIAAPSFLGVSLVGIDFNPVPDLNAGAASLRLTRGGPPGDNVRVNVNSGVVGVTTPDTAINGATTFLSAIAYSDNDRDPATGTTLYGIVDGSLFQVPNPNAGTATFVGSLGIGLTPADPEAYVGFDVSGFSGQAFASVTTLSGLSRFYSINLTSGAATLIGGLDPASGDVFLDVTAATIPEPETCALMLAGISCVGWATRRRQRSGAKSTS